MELINWEKEMAVDFEKREGLPKQSNRPWSEFGYKYAWHCLDAMFECGCLTETKHKTATGDPTTFRTIIEDSIHIFNNGRTVYVSKGDVFSALVDVIEYRDLNVELKPICSHHLDNVNLSLKISDEDISKIMNHHPIQSFNNKRTQKVLLKFEKYFNSFINRFETFEEKLGKKS